MPREPIDAADLYTGVPCSYLGIAPPGSTVFTAGACPLDEKGHVVCLGDLAGQARKALDNLLLALDAAGCGTEDIVKTTVYVATTDRADLETAWAIVEEVFGKRGPPSTLLGVTVLGWPGQLVEIEAVAAGRE
jgi:enamine deaminase RidA (YjgF/YER057c/UK114 family)